MKLNLLANQQFDISLIVDKDNNLVVIDNTVDDWREYVDCNTMLIKEVKLGINFPKESKI